MAKVVQLARILRAHQFAADAALALLLAALVVSEILTSQSYLTAPEAVYLPVALLMTLPLAWRRRFPFAVELVVMGAFAAQSIAVDPKPAPDIELVPALIAVYSVAANSERRVALLGAAYALGAGLVWLGVDDFLLPTVVFGGAWLAGRLVQQRQRYAEVLAERASVLERERDANARIAAAEERVRLARELHDAIGHSVSVMVVQAGAERLALGTERPDTREALLAIERTGREALAEMSRLLGLLRGKDEALALAPRPSLDHVAELVRTVRETGLPVELRIEGMPRSLPAGIDVSAYRILQEALTNVVKHAGQARASVAVRYGPGDVELVVTDDGRGPLDDRNGGYGLDGMRERVELHGGTLETGPNVGGGFTVRARLPVPAVTA
jgi:signal transduction histidine kinase